MLISIFSPKGGVGKTTLTLALANSLSDNNKVCVIEYDFSPGDFPAILDVSTQKNIMKAITNVGQGIQKPRGKNYDVIVGGYPDDYDKISASKLNNLIDALYEKYDIVLVDIQPGFIESCIDVMSKSDKVVLIVEDDMRIAARVNGFLDWLKINNISDLSNYAYIKNMSRSKELYYLDKIRYKLPILYSVPYIKNLKGIDDKRLKSHIKKVSEVILN